MFRWQNLEEWIGGFVQFFFLTLTANFLENFIPTTKCEAYVSETISVKGLKSEMFQKIICYLNTFNLISWKFCRILIFYLKRIRSKSNPFLLALNISNALLWFKLFILVTKIISFGIFQRKTSFWKKLSGSIMHICISIEYLDFIWIYHCRLLLPKMN